MLIFTYSTFEFNLIFCSCTATMKMNLKALMLRWQGDVCVFILRCSIARLLRVLMVLGLSEAQDHS